MYVLGMSLGHERAAALVRDGELVAAIEEERLDRMKHSAGGAVVPMKSVTYVLEAAGIGIDEVDVAVGNRPFDDGSAGRLLAELPIRDKNRLYGLPMPSHHLAHAYAGYLASPFDSAAVLVVDGVGSLVPGTDRIEKHTVFVGEGTALRRVYGATYPADRSSVGIGLFYSFFSAKLGFAAGGYPDDSTTMSLAAYGTARPEWEPLLAIDEGDIVAEMAHLECAFARWRAAFGNGWTAERPQSWRDQFGADLARKAQDEAEAAMVHLARHVYELTGQRRLCLTGSVALNHGVNQRIAVEGPFEELYILPAAGDAGVAIGAAYFGYYAIGGGTTRHHLASPALGRGYGRGRVVRALESTGEMVYWREASVPEIAALIADNYVVGWVQGGSEMGTHGLGHRSILANPSHPRMRDYLNQVVTRREEFQPYAASVLVEKAGEWFEMTADSPFMLLAPRVRVDRRPVVPAITHVDGSAPVQTVRAETNPRFHQLIAELDRSTGVPIVLNTPFHGAGEPIVESPADAVRAFLDTELDYLYLGDLLIGKQHRELPKQHPRRTGATVAAEHVGVRLPAVVGGTAQALSGNGATS